MISFKQLYKYIIYWENNSSIRFIRFIFEKKFTLYVYEYEYQMYRTNAYI